MHLQHNNNTTKQANTITAVEAAVIGTNNNKQQQPLIALHVIVFIKMNYSFYNTLYNKVVTQNKAGNALSRMVVLFGILAMRVVGFNTMKEKNKMIFLSINLYRDMPMDETANV